MNRRLWGPVIVVVCLLAGVSFATSSRDQIIAAVAVATPWLVRAEAVLATLSWPVVGAIAAAAVALVAIGALVSRRRRTRGGFAEPWRTVIEMGRKGQSSASIAQATGLSQDAVRIVLAPVAVEPTLPAGKTFRSTQPGRAGQRTGRSPGPGR